MKFFITLYFLSLVMLMSCRPEQANLPKEEPIVAIPDTHTIGDGVEIYRALLHWQNGPHLTRYFTTGTVLGDTPVFRYDDIKRYYKFFRDGDTWQIAFEMNRKIFNGYSQDSPILGVPYLFPQSASDTGYVVTINRIPIYFSYYRNRNFPNKTKNKI